MDLSKKIKLFAKGNKIVCKQLMPSDGNILIEQLIKPFGIDLSIRYAWESVSKDLVTLCKYDESNWSLLFSEVLIDFSDNIYLVVTDDEFYPWDVFECEKKDVDRIVSGNPYFEFFIFDKAMDKILFDTHDNAFCLAMLTNIGL